MTKTIDLSTYTIEELDTLVFQAEQARIAKTEAKVAEKEAIKAKTGKHIKALEKLLGAEKNPNADTIRGLRNFTPDDYELFKDTTLVLLIDALEQLALRTIDALKISQ